MAGRSTSFALALFIIPAAAMAAGSLEGTWRHQRDSGGWKVLAGGDITLRLDKNGRAQLSAVAPKQNPMEVPGTWSESAGRVTINIPDQLEVKNQPYQLAGDTLNLPSHLSDDKPGTSTWVRVNPQGVDLVFAAFNRAVEEGKGGASAAEEAAREARKQKDVEKAEVTAGGEGLELTVAGRPGPAGKPRVLILFATKPAPRTPPVQRKGPVSPLASDPRTHLDAQNPPGDPDAPPARTALVVAPFTDRPYFAFRTEVFQTGDTKPRPLSAVAQSTTFRQLGDDPDGNARLLEKAGYQTTVLLDDKSGPGAVFRALQAKPGVIYFATHGGIGRDGSAVAIGGFIGASGGTLTFEEATRKLQEMMLKEGVPGRAAAAVTVGCVDHLRGRGLCFPMLWPKFFEEALGPQGVPSSFVFLDACHTAHSPALARAFKARAFLGYGPTVAGWATARFTRHLFSNMVRRGHSVREAWDRLRDMCEGSYVVWLEDSIVSKVEKGDVDLGREAQGLVAWGIDQKPYERIGAETAWLLRQARWSTSDVNKGADALTRCLDLFWKPGKRPGIGEPFCNSGIATHTPTAAEVEDARHLVCGRPPQPVGRFVLR